MPSTVIAYRLGVDAEEDAEEEEEAAAEEEEDGGAPLPTTNCSVTALAIALSHTIPLSHPVQSPWNTCTILTSLSSA